MIKYILGFIKYLFQRGVSIFALIDESSEISKKARVFRRVKLFKSKLGDYSYVAPFTEVINADVGKFCSIARSCMIGLPSHTLNNLSTSPIFTEPKNALGRTWTLNSNSAEITKPVKIENDVWVGARSIVLGGVKIGNGAVIAAGAVVTKDVPAYAVVAGVPAKIIKYRFNKDLIEQIESLKWWDWNEDVLIRKIDAFQTRKAPEIYEKLTGSSKA